MAHGIVAAMAHGIVAATSGSRMIALEGVLELVPGQVPLKPGRITADELLEDERGRLRVIK